MSSGNSFSAIYDNQDRLIRLNNNIYSYNSNGDLLSKSVLLNQAYQNTNYQYDVFGNLKQVGRVSYQLDPLLRRKARLVDGIVTHQYAYNPEGQLIGEMDANGNITKSFVYASRSHVPDYYVDNAGVKYKIITDQLGSVRLVVNTNTGAVVQKMFHDEFGKVTTDSNPGLQPFGFAGGLYDAETKLVRFGARDYDPEIGRWTSKDPIRFKGGDSNLYGYVLQDPVNWIDPSGKNPLLIVPVYTGMIGAIVGGISGGILSDSDTAEGVLSDIGSGILIGGIGGFMTGVGAIAPGGIFTTIGGVAIDAGINAWGLGDIINGGNSNNSSCKLGK